jgi:hypothetical protein
MNLKLDDDMETTSGVLDLACKGGEGWKIFEKVCEEVYEIIDEQLRGHSQKTSSGLSQKLYNSEVFQMDPNQESTTPSQL